MPAGDGTGPEGRGPRTGRGMGYCAGYDAPGAMSPGPGRGWGGRGRGWGPGMGGGRAWGWGRGRRHPYYAAGSPDWGAPEPPPYSYSPYAAPTPQQELDFLKAQAQELHSQLEALNQRIAELGEQTSQT